MSSAMDLQAQTKLPIAQIGPSVDSTNTVIRGVVALVWPYSSSTHSTTILLVEPDFRLRRNNGQVRITFKNSSAKAIVRSGLSSGDTLVLRLLGVEWCQNEEVIKIPGRGVEWDMRYSERLVLQIERESQHNTLLDINHPTPSPVIQPLSPTPPVSPLLDGLLQGSQRRFDDPAKPQTWTSPAFLKRKRLATGTHFYSTYDPLLDKDDYTKGLGKKRTKFGRFSGQWRFAERTPSSDRGGVVEKTNNIDLGPFVEATGVDGESKSLAAVGPVRLSSAQDLVEQNDVQFDQESQPVPVESAPSLDTVANVVHSDNAEQEPIESQTSAYQSIPPDDKLVSGVPNDEARNDTIDAKPLSHSDHDTLSEEANTAAANVPISSSQDVTNLHIDTTFATPDVSAVDEISSELRTPDPPQLKPLLSPGLPLVSPLLDRKGKTLTYSNVHDPDSLYVETGPTLKLTETASKSPLSNEVAPKSRSEVKLIDAAIEEYENDSNLGASEPLSTESSPSGQRPDGLNSNEQNHQDKERLTKDHHMDFVYSGPFSDQHYPQDDDILQPRGYNERVELEDEHDQAYPSYPQASRSYMSWANGESFNSEHLIEENMDSTSILQTKGDTQSSIDIIDSQEARKTRIALRVFNQKETRAFVDEPYETLDITVGTQESRKYSERELLANLMDELSEESEAESTISYATIDNKIAQLSVDTLLSSQIIDLDDPVYNYDSGGSDDKDDENDNEGEIGYEDEDDEEEEEEGKEEEEGQEEHDKEGEDQGNEQEYERFLSEQDKVEEELDAIEMRETQKSQNGAVLIDLESNEANSGDEVDVNSPVDQFVAAPNDEEGLQTIPLLEGTEAHLPDIPSSIIGSSMIHESNSNAQGTDPVYVTQLKETDEINEDSGFPHSSDLEDPCEYEHKLKNGSASPTLPIVIENNRQSLSFEPNQDYLESLIDPRLQNQLITPADTQQIPISPIFPTRASIKIIETDDDLLTPQPTQNFLKDSIPPSTPANPYRPSLIEKLKELRTSSTEKQKKNHHFAAQTKTPWFTSDHSDHPVSESVSANASAAESNESSPTSSVDHNDLAKQSSPAAPIRVAPENHVYVVIPPLHTAVRSGLQTPLSYFAPLAALSSYFSQTTDVLALALTATAPLRANSGPRDWYQSIYLVDRSLYNPNSSHLPSTSTSTSTSTSSPAIDIVTALLFRPSKVALPVLKTPSAILLRNFKVVSQNRKLSLLSTDSSAWALFPPTLTPSSPETEKQEVQIHGPPVEFGNEETSFASSLLHWFMHDLSPSERSALLEEAGERMRKQAEKDAKTKVREKKKDANTKIGEKKRKKNGERRTVGMTRGVQPNGNTARHQLRDGTSYTDTDTPRAGMKKSAVHELRDGTTYTDELMVGKSETSGSGNGAGTDVHELRDGTTWKDDGGP